MSFSNQDFIDERKKYIIRDLIFNGIYKKDGNHLYELDLAELEEFSSFIQLEMKEKFKRKNM
jgi:Fur-regulated basic protein A